MYSVKRLFNPEIYQGKYRTKNYFEGWYFKLIDRESKNILAIIPGVSVAGREKHAFIQFIDANSGFTAYTKFHIKDFMFSEYDFDISIEKNHFNRFGLTVDFTVDNLNIKGKIDFSNIVPFPKTILNPGIMGPFSFIPFMECHHGIINIHCDLEGYLFYNGKKIDFTGGYGYLEKDWGSSFPESWIWFQSNHFEKQNSSVMFSIASIPWFNTRFNGLISFLKVEDEIFRFATYTGARVKKLSFENDKLSILVNDSEHSLEMTVNNTKGGVLKAPKKGMMDVDITETITSTVEVCLYDRQGKKKFEGVGNNTGLELAGDYNDFVI